MTQYWISLRPVKSGAFTDGIADKSIYLAAPDDRQPAPADRVVNAVTWATQVIAALGTPDSRGAYPRDIVFFVHGYDNTVDNVFQRHQGLTDGLQTAGYGNVVVSFDWPSDDKTLAYLEDRQTVKKTAMRLVTDGIRLFSKMSTPGCTVNVHIVAHSMGAYLVREAFDDADDSTLAATNWTIGQLALVAGDVSSGSLSTGDPTSESVYRHCYRLNNYFSGYDEALQVSNVKRLGLSPRVGRVGLPAQSPDKAIDINCSTHYEASLPQLQAAVPAGVFLSHSWYFYDQTFMADLASTLSGAKDRNVLPTRTEAEAPNSFTLT
jgi:esterase/lipase superfamily enzyme